MILRHIRPFLMLLPVLLVVSAPPAALAAKWSGGVYQFTLSNALPKDMTFDFAYTSVETNQEIRERFTVPARQTLQFTYSCAFGSCVSAYLNVLGLNDYIACASQLELTGGTAAVALKDADLNGSNAAFSCAFQGDGFFRTDTQYGVYGLTR
jgi:hypothetical protein